MSISAAYRVPAAETVPAVRLSDVTRSLGIPMYVQHEIVKQRLVEPVRPMGRGKPAYVSPEDAELVKRAAKIATAIGITIVIVLKVLTAPAS